MSTSSLGTTVKVTPSGKSAVTVGLLRSVSEIRLDSAVIDVTPLDAAGGFRQYVQGFRDAGEITLEGFLDKDQTGQTTLRGLYLSGETAAFAVTFPDGETISFSALVRAFSTGAAEVDNPVLFRCVLRITGAATFS